MHKGPASMPRRSLLSRRSAQAESVAVAVEQTEAAPPESMGPRAVEAVPPFPTVSAEARVRAPADAEEEGAVRPRAGAREVSRAESRLVLVAFASVVLPVTVRV